MDMKMNLLAVPPSKIQNKAVSRYALEKYFGAKTVEQLLLILRHARRANYLNFGVTIDPEYLVWQEGRLRVAIRAEGNSQPHYPFSVLLPDTSGLAWLLTKIRNNTPLTDQEIARAIHEAPSDVAERYLRFTLRDIDQKELREFVKQPKRRASGYGDYEYKGLSIRGVEVAYQGKSIYMSPQQREVLRVFLAAPEALRTPDIFTGNADIFSPKRHYNDVNVTLGKLIPSVHKLLQEAIGEPCIFNKAKEGWKLKIE
jgi:hypothetical protein